MLRHLSEIFRKVCPAYLAADFCPVENEPHCFPSSRSYSSTLYEISCERWSRSLTQHLRRSKLRVMPRINIDGLGRLQVGRYARRPPLLFNPSQDFADGCRTGPCFPFRRGQRRMGYIYPILRHVEKVPSSGHSLIPRFFFGKIPPSLVAVLVAYPSSSQICTSTVFSQLRSCSRVLFPASRVDTPLCPRLCLRRPRLPLLRP